MANNGWEIRQKARRTHFMRGWDACLRGESLGSCPYRYEDKEGQWKAGWNACFRGDELPSWYPEWAKTPANRRVQLIGNR